MGFNSFIVAFSTFTLGLASGVVGTFLILRKRALISDALAHGALPGLCTAFILGYYITGHGRNLLFLLLGASISGFLSTLIIQILVRATRIKEDAALASVLSIFFGFGIMLLSIIQNMGTGEEGGLNHFIYGQTAAMGMNDAILMSVVALFVVFICSILHKEFGLLCFNSEYALSIGINISLLDFVLMFMATIVIVVGLQAVGMLLVVSMLIIPAAAARFWTNNLRILVIISAIFGGISGLVGSMMSSLLPDLPAGGVIVLVSGFIFIVSFILGLNNSLLGSLLNIKKLRSNIAS